MMRDNRQQNRFEITENGLPAWAEYRIQDGVYVITHVEADPSLRGTGAASRLMDAIVAAARAGGFTLAPRCSYAQIWFRRHTGAHDVLA
jgi:predicted GNAT family acetyltransferase